MKSAQYKNLAHALLDLTEGKSSGEQAKAVKDFAAYLSEHRKLGQAGKIIAEYSRLYNERHGILEAQVILTSRLPETTKAHLKETLKKKYGATEVELEEKVDQRVLGGMKVKIGDTVYDGTLQNSLKQLETALLK